jgi:hypothetical protein
MHAGVAATAPIIESLPSISQASLGCRFPLPFKCQILINRAVPQREQPHAEGPTATIPAQASSFMAINFGGPR